MGGTTPRRGRRARVVVLGLGLLGAGLYAALRALDEAIRGERAELDARALDGPSPVRRSAGPARDARRPGVPGPPATPPPATPPPSVLDLRDEVVDLTPPALRTS